MKGVRKILVLAGCLLALSGPGVVPGAVAANGHDTHGAASATSGELGGAPGGSPDGSSGQEAVGGDRPVVPGEVPATIMRPDEEAARPGSMPGMPGGMMSCGGGCPMMSGMMSGPMGGPMSGMTGGMGHGMAGMPGMMGQGMMGHGPMMSGMMSGMGHGSMSGPMSGMTGEHLMPMGDRAFLAAMIPHHEAAVAMAEAVLKNGKDSQVKKWAEAVITSQQAEIRQMRDMLAVRGGPGPEGERAAAGMRASMEMMAQMMAQPMAQGGMQGGADPDVGFVAMMVEHHAGAVDMASRVVIHTWDDAVLKLADGIVRSQWAEIMAYKAWLKARESR